MPAAPVVHPRKPGRICALRTVLLALMMAAVPVAHTATLEDGYDAFEVGNVEQAISIWKELAANGNTTAQFNLGQIYRLGQGVPQDDGEAYYWYLLAAQNGMVSAKHNLIMMYEEGKIPRGHIAPLLQTGNNRLKTMSPEHFLVQVIATSSREALDAYIDQHLRGLQHPATVVLMNSRGKDLYTLMLGPYTGLPQAEAALSGLPEQVRNEGAWIRKVATAQASLHN